MSFEGTGEPEAAPYRNVRRVAAWLDEAFVIPGTRLRIGWDGLLGLIPGAGDLLTTLPALWIVLRSVDLGVSRAVAARMVLNLVIDDVVGAVPVVGDLFDITWKANRRNAELLERHLHQSARTRRRRGPALAAAAAALLLIGGLLIAIPILVLAWLFRSGAPP